MDLALGVVPVECNPDVLLPRPVRFDSVASLLDRLLQMFCVLLSNVFDPKVIYHKSELYWAPVVLPKARDQFAGTITKRIQLLLEELVGLDARSG